MKISFDDRIKNLFRKYKVGYEYMVALEDIEIPSAYKATKIRKGKWLHKLGYWKETGKFESQILIDRDFKLVDGFSSCKIAYVNGVKYVPVYFIN